MNWEITTRRKCFAKIAHQTTSFICRPANQQDAEHNNNGMSTVEMVCNITLNSYKSVDIDPNHFSPLWRRGGLVHVESMSDFQAEGQWFWSALCHCDVKLFHRRVSMAVFILEMHNLSGRTWVNMCSLSYYVSCSSPCIKMCTKWIIHLEELSSVMHHSRRTTEDS